MKNDMVANVATLFGYGSSSDIKFVEEPQVSCPLYQPLPQITLS